MLSLVRLAAFAFVLTGCSTVYDPSLTVDQAVSQSEAATSKNGYIGMTVAFETPDVKGESCVLISLENLSDRQESSLRVCDRDLPNDRGQRSGSVLFAVPAGRYKVETAQLRLPGSFGGNGYTAVSQLEKANRVIVVEPQGFLHLATVGLAVKTSANGSYLRLNYREQVRYERPSESAWQQFAPLLSKMPASYLASNGEIRAIDWSFLAE